ncbi:MAG TPA: hypothetical protein PK052_03605 [Anaerohalosphaeraceae bacterium]|nr:hypothetical protein [Anaerohalosphaeraceae bacterium]HOL31046.1 hypothetical protein [Anaerohalosphaeraceae bacterium]HOM75886.1 hypothetical protein [Anaerohalosphaeraceae bacterium]HPC64139.1 hypothetical protein [Anaerohalosphaeraceae bacterium]HPO69883.1 hypothetical protein [Anaerohalosphaeraceae bacterium]
MIKLKSMQILIIGLCTVLNIWASDVCPNADKTDSYNSQTADSGAGDLEQILSRIVESTRQLKSCQARLSYLFVQDPDLLASRTLRTGTLYYINGGEKSLLRIHFQDIKQDDFEPEARREEYLFDGVWLTRIDFKLKQVDQFQQAPEDKPMDVFELISHNFPIVGFSGTDKLQQDFNIALKEKNNDPNEPICLLLEVKQGSKFHEEYEKIDFWIDPANYLPKRLLAYAVQGDLYDISFSDIEINKKLEKSVFTIETPADFRKNVEPLKNSGDRKGT